MKLEVNRRQLLAAVKTARKFQSAELCKGNAVLESVELCADAGDLTVMSNGGFTWYRAPLAAELHEDGTVLASANRLQKLLAGIRDTTVTLSARRSTRDDLTVTFEAGSAALTLGLESTGELPPWPVSPIEPAAVLLSLPLPTLRRMLGKVAHAILPGGKEERCGFARLRLTDGLLILEATDGHRAIRVETHGIHGAEVEGIAFPLDAIARVVQLKHDCLVTLLEYQGKVLLHLATGERVAFASTGIETFPKVETVLARREESAIGARIAIRRESLLAAAQAASAIAAPLAFTTSDDRETLILTSESKGAGKFTQSLEAEVCGDLALTGMNPAYVVEALEAIETSEVDIEFGDNPEADYIAFTPTMTARSNETQREIVMPIRIAEDPAEEAPKKKSKKVAG